MTDAPQDEPVHSVSEILDKLRGLADAKNRVSIGDVLDAIGDRSYGPALILPALIEISPIGGIPGLPTFLAIIIALVAVQLLFGKEHLWLPQFIQKRAISGDKLHKAADKLDGMAGRLDRWFHGRLTRFVKGVWPRIAAGFVILLCLTVPPLELVPFASTAPMAAIIAFGLALLVRDGLLMLIALGAGLISIGVGAGLIGSSGLISGS
ncbi:exopolysaccharide biosynthesis protein [Qipengyuania spongiae]|uniref:Exopolysaccharide biosynthesis protein n=1 Tax=Qipengyuania spongiae TaxID=2909673 RepID=A0ABY5SZE7_9SPHN|nr:exopolysaccharide biosynthesis protein [Qipengyuania spongiae]UVI39629.1 exopolysaccharide biosynthesis protein [Qipengyuania spongiae]